MAASGAKVEPEVQEQYIQASIITRIVGNVLKREQHDASNLYPRTSTVALFVQKVISILDLLQDIDRTSEGYTTLPDQQKVSLQQLYDYCLYETSHPEEMDFLQEKIKTTINCVYQNEGSVTNWFNAASYLCGNIRANLSKIQACALDDAYLELVEISRVKITRDTLAQGPASLARMLKNLSLVESKPVVCVIPDAPPPPPYLLSKSFRYKEGGNEKSSSSAPQTSTPLSMADILAKRKELNIGRGSKTIEQRLLEAKALQKELDAKESQDGESSAAKILFNHPTFQKLAKMHDDNSPSLGRVIGSMNTDETDLCTTPKSSQKIKP